MKDWKKAAKELGIVKGKIAEGTPEYWVYGAEGIPPPPPHPPLGRLQAPNTESRINKSWC